MPSHEGVEVSVQGTNVTAISDSVGKWMLHGVSTGIHTIRFRKTGFFDRFLPEVQFVGGGTITLNPRTLFAHPTFEVSQVHVAFEGSNVIRVDGTVSQTSPELYRVLICYDTTRRVSPDKHIFVGQGLVHRDSTRFHQGEYLLRDKYRIRAGSIMYVRAYPASGVVLEHDPFTFEDYPANFLQNPSPIDSAIIP